MFVTFASTTEGDTSSGSARNGCITRIQNKWEEMHISSVGVCVCASQGKRWWQDFALLFSTMWILLFASGHKNVFNLTVHIFTIFKSIATVVDHAAILLSLSHQHQSPSLKEWIWSICLWSVLFSRINRTSPATSRPSKANWHFAWVKLPWVPAIHLAG